MAATSETPRMVMGLSPSVSCFRAAFESNRILQSGAHFLNCVQDMPCRRDRMVENFNATSQGLGGKGSMLEVKLTPWANICIVTAFKQEDRSEPDLILAHRSGPDVLV
jgi:hypothetical protein